MNPVHTGRSVEAMAKAKAPPIFIEPMAATGVTELPCGEDWLYEIKWDGFRGQIIKDGKNVRLLSRLNNSVASDFPEVVDAAKHLKTPSVILDGEIVVIGEDGRPSFQNLLARAKRTRPAIFIAFDILMKDGKSLVSQPLDRRRAELEKVVRGSEIRMSAEVRGTPEAIIHSARENGLEGIVAKKRTSLYRSGDRHPDWQKLRIGHQQEFVIGGYVPNGKEFEGLLVGYYEAKQLIYAGNIRSGFSTLDKRSLAALLKIGRCEKCPFTNLPDAAKGRWGGGITAKDMEAMRWVRPINVAQIQFTSWSDRGRVRHGVFIGLRKDKRSKDVVREISPS